MILALSMIVTEWILAGWQAKREHIHANTSRRAGFMGLIIRYRTSGIIHIFGSSIYRFLYTSDEFQSLIEQICLPNQGSFDDPFPSFAKSGLRPARSSRF